MAKHSIPARFVGKVDQDLTTARANLEQHLEDFARFHAQGDAPETVFAGFAAAVLRETNPYHLAVMFSAAVLALHERGQREETTTGFYFVSTSFRAMSVIHRPCNQTAGVIHNHDEPDLDQFRQVAAEHLGGCEA